jgi:transglutaminase-like putative cysteine protease
MIHPDRCRRNPGSSRGAALLTLALVILPALVAPPAGAVGAGGAVGARPWEQAPFTAEPRAVLAAAERDSAGAKEPVVILLADTRYRYDEAGRATETWYLVYRITGPGAGASWSTVEQGWSPWHQERPRIRARVLTPDGTAHLLDPATLSESGEVAESEDVFEDRRVLRGPLPAAGPGTVIEQEITTVDTAPLFDRGVVKTVGFGGEVPVRHASLQIDAPDTLPLRWVSHLLPPGAPREVRTAGRHQLTFDYPDLQPAPPVEPGMPADLPRRPSVAFSTGGSWREVAARYAEIVDGRIRGADLAALRSAVGPTDSQLERIDRLLAVLHREVRYTGVELGEASIVPRTPAETLKRHYGDCKDKAALLAALLRAEDIPAFVALLRAGPGHDVEPTLPGLGGFDHAIVFVPGAPAVWIDPTEPFARAGELPTGDQGRLALVVSADSTALLRTPEVTSAENRRVETREITLADSGLARQVLITETAGAPGRGLRHLVADSDRAATKKRLEEYFSTSEFTLAKGLDAYESADPSDLVHPFRMRLETAQSRRGATDRRQAVVGIPLQALLGHMPDELQGNEAEKNEKPRQADYEMSVPFLLEIHYRILPPAGYAPRELPKARHRTFGPATLDETYAAGPDGTTTVTIRFDSGRRRLSPKEFDDFRVACRELRKEKPVVLHFDQVGEAHLAAGRVREALQEFHRLAAAAPAKAGPHTHLAYGLLEGGMGAAARQEARRAVALEPRSVEAQSTLAFVLEHDEIGRLFGQGFDYAGALAAWRAARQLDPADQETRSQLAFLLEHDALGRRFTAGADLASALAERRVLRDEIKSDEMTANLATDLLWLGKATEARQVLQGSQRLALTLVAIALTDGAEAATREAEQRETSPQARLEALTSAVGVLTLLRHYGEAADLLPAAVRSSPQAAALLNQAEVLKKMRRHEEIRIGLDRPEGLAKRLLFATFAPVDHGRDLEALLARPIRELKGGAEEWDHVVTEVRHTLQKSSLPPDVVLDATLAQAEVVTEGDDALGYRLDIRIASGEVKKNWTIYGVREGSEYRLAAFEGATETLASEAWRRLQAKDLPGARQWLDWSLPATPPAADDDPFSPPLVTILWHKGEAASEEETRCAAAALLAPIESYDLEPILLRCREATPDRLRQGYLDLALAIAHRAHEHPAEALAVARRVAQAWPSSKSALALELALLSLERRFDELHALADQRLAAHPDDPFAARMLGDLAMQKGDFDEVRRLRERMTRAGTVEAGDLNNFAWAALASGRVEDADLESARRGATLEDYKSYATLHTLAALYAETGKTAEAYRVILQAISLRGDQPQGSDWFVFGQLAEQYGLPEEARGYYQRVPAAPRDAEKATSTYRLAQNRLAALRKGHSKGDHQAAALRP